MPFICHERSIGTKAGILKGVKYVEWNATTSLQQWAGMSLPSKTNSSNLFISLHGWLDNAASFAPLFNEVAPQIHASFLSLDLPGHGKSAWRPNQVSYAYLDWVVLLHNLFISQGWRDITLIGHSLGGSIAAVFSSLFPQLVRQLVLIDSFGPVPEIPSEIKQRFQTFCSEIEDVPTQANIYKNFEKLVKARERSPFASMSQESARILMERGTHKEGSEWVLCSDPRLKLPSSFRLSMTQAKSLLEGLSCPTLILRNKDHKTPEYWESYQSTIDSCKDLKLIDIEGGHHLHMENTQEVAMKILRFLK